MIRAYITQVDDPGVEGRYRMFEIRDRIRDLTGWISYECWG